MRDGVMTLGVQPPVCHSTFYEQYWILEPLARPRRNQTLPALGREPIRPLPWDPYPLQRRLRRVVYS